MTSSRSLGFLHPHNYHWRVVPGRVSMGPSWVAYGEAAAITLISLIMGCLFFCSSGPHNSRGCLLLLPPFLKGKMERHSEQYDNPVSNCGDAITVHHCNYFQWWWWELQFYSWSQDSRAARTTSDTPTTIPSSQTPHIYPSLCNPQTSRLSPCFLCSSSFLFMH